jgi:hypothetical protein
MMISNNNVMGGGNTLTAKSTKNTKNPLRKKTGKKTRMAAVPGSGKFFYLYHY